VARKATGLAAVSISLGSIGCVLQLGMFAYWLAVLYGSQWLAAFSILAILAHMAILGIAGFLGAAAILLAVIALVRARSSGVDRSPATRGLVIGLVAAAMVAAQVLSVAVDWHPETLNP
jgi:hypothetical protein